MKSSLCSLDGQSCRKRRNGTTTTSSTGTTRYNNGVSQSFYTPSRPTTTKKPSFAWRPPTSPPSSFLKRRRDQQQPETSKSVHRDCKPSLFRRFVDNSNSHETTTTTRNDCLTESSVSSGNDTPFAVTTKPPTSSSSTSAGGLLSGEWPHLWRVGSGVNSNNNNSSSKMPRFFSSKGGLRRNKPRRNRIWKPRKASDEEEIVFPATTNSITENSSEALNDSARGSSNGSSTSADTETASVASNEPVVDTFWSSILRAAMTDTPSFDVDVDTDLLHGMDSSDQRVPRRTRTESDSMILCESTDDDSSSSSSCCSDSSFVSDEEEEEANEWIDLTKDPMLRVSGETPPTTTALSDALWRRQFDLVQSRLAIHPQEVSKRIPLPGTASRTGNILHLACAMRPLPPFAILQDLLNAHSEAAKQPESLCGMLPLHFAVNLDSTQVDATQSNEDAITAPSLTSQRIDNHVQIIKLLLQYNPDGMSAIEQEQSRTPLHVAVATTTQAMNGNIPLGSYMVLQTLVEFAFASKDTSCCDVPDVSGLTPLKLAQLKSSAPTTTCFSGVHWKPNPVLQLPLHLSKSTPMKTIINDASLSDVTSVTSATASVTLSHASNSTWTEHDMEEDDDDDFSDAASDVALEEMKQPTSSFKYDGTLLPVTPEETMSMISDSDTDDGTFFTANSSPDSASLQTAMMELDREMDRALGLSLDDEDEEESDDMRSVSSFVSARSSPCRASGTTLSRQNSRQVELPQTNYVPRVLNVEKISLMLQLHASNLILPSKTMASHSRGLGHVPSLIDQAVNPYYCIELLHPASDVSVVLHESKPLFCRREAHWDPVCFAVDATKAQSMGMVLQISMYHRPQEQNQKGLLATTQSKPATKKSDVLIGSYSAPIWDLHQGDTLSLNGMDDCVTGQIQLTRCEMKAHNKSECWRIFL